MSKIRRLTITIDDNGLLDGCPNKRRKVGHAVDDVFESLTDSDPEYPCLADKLRMAVEPHSPSHRGITIHFKVEGELPWE